MATERAVISVRRVQHRTIMPRLEVDRDARPALGDAETSAGTAAGDHDADRAEHDLDVVEQ